MTESVDTKQQQQQQKQERAHALTIERLTGKMLFVDPVGQSWGLKIFTLRENEMFLRSLWNAITVDNPVAWTVFAQMCVVAYSERPGVKVTVRRALGLYDYSALHIWRKLVGNVNTFIKFRDAIVMANVGKNFARYILDSSKPETKVQKAKRKITGSWPEMIASYFFHKGMMPDEILSLTLPQLEAIAEYGKKETGAATRRSMLDDLKDQMGMRR